MPLRNIAFGRKDVLAVAVFLFLSVSVVGWWFWGVAWLIIPLGLGMVIILALMLEVRSRQEEVRRLQLDQKSRSEQHYKQIEALFSLFFTLQPRVPFPAMRGWAASPDLLKLISQTIHREGPSLIVEASSGVSTLICAYTLQLLGGGEVISLEHDLKHAALTRQLVELHGLQNTATVIHAPLRTMMIDGEEWLWYDTSCLKRLCGH